jgi:hypothetical protein
MSRLWTYMIAACIVLVLLTGCPRTHRGSVATTPPARQVPRLASPSRLKTPGDPVSATSTFVQAVRTGEEDALMPAVTADSQGIIKLGNTRGRHGVFYFLRCNAPFDVHVQYELLLVRKSARNAQVNIVAKRNGPAEFFDIRLPKKIRAEGVAIMLVDEDGRWKVDLMATEEAIATAILDAPPNDLRKFTPPWWPCMPGMPPPPGS